MFAMFEFIRQICFHQTFYTLTLTRKPQNHLKRAYKLFSGPQEVFSKCAVWYNGIICKMLTKVLHGNTACALRFGNENKKRAYLQTGPLQVQNKKKEF